MIYNGKFRRTLRRKEFLLRWRAMAFGLDESNTCDASFLYSDGQIESAVLKQLLFSALPQTGLQAPPGHQACFLFVFNAPHFLYVLLRALRKGMQLAAGTETSHADLIAELQQRLVCRDNA